MENIDPTRISRETLLKLKCRGTDEEIRLALDNAWLAMSQSDRGVVASLLLADELAGRVTVALKAFEHKGKAT